MATEKERDVPANDGSSNMRSCRRMDIEYQLDREHLSCIRGDAGFPWKPGKSNPCARCGFCSPHSAQEAADNANVRVVRCIAGLYRGTDIASAEGPLGE